MKKQNFTALFKKTGKYYAAWVLEIPGVHSQGKTIEEAKANLQEALALILETNEMLTLKELGKTKFIKSPIQVSYPIHI